MAFTYYKLIKRGGEDTIITSGIKQAYPNVFKGNILNWYLLLDSEEKMNRFFREYGFFILNRTIFLRKYFYLLLEGEEIDFEYPIDFLLYKEIFRIKSGQNRNLKLITFYIRNLLRNIAEKFKKEGVVLVNCILSTVPITLDKREDGTIDKICIPLNYDSTGIRKRNNIVFKPML